MTAAGCGGGDQAAEETELPGGPPLERLGKGEGRLDLVAWPGYAEDGSVAAFERTTGCRVRVRVAASSDEMAVLLRAGLYDGASTSGDTTLRLILRGDAAPLNTALVPNYRDVFPGLKARTHNSLQGRPYGVPIGRAANLLAWRADRVSPAPTGWDVVWDPDPAYAGRVTVYDSPMAIADAALRLKRTRPELGIENVYELDRPQFRAAVELLERRRPLVGEYWSGYTRGRTALAAGDTVVGTTWQRVAEQLAARGVPIETRLPQEGSTGWSDTWVISSKAKHPNCMYRWLNHASSPAENARLSERLGTAPANRKACALTVDRDHCRVYHAADERYFSRVAFWTTPQGECGDDRGGICMDYSAWVLAWLALR